jgi:NADPH:quinone reductase-like Zn-dependent oxidoreductase
MRAAVQDRYGPPKDVLQIRVVPVPALEGGEVLVKVAAASVNALDWHYTTGLPMFARATMGLRRPLRTTPGVDVAGTVVAVGRDVSRWRAGDEVFGQVAGGGFAEYVAAPADWLVRRPDEVDVQDAATLGVAAETALQALRDWGRLQPGQRVLINGASGGVGTFAVQLARVLGAGHVTAVCSTANLETALRLGADTVVDYTVEDHSATSERYDLFLDNAGAWSLGRCRRVLTARGTYVMVTAPKSTWLHPLPRIIATPAAFLLSGRRAVSGRTAQHSLADLELLRDLVSSGALRPVMDRQYRLDEVSEALQRQGRFHSRGKSLVLP